MSRPLSLLLCLLSSTALAQAVYPPIIPQAGTNLLPLNNTWTGTNAWTSSGQFNGISLPSGAPVNLYTSPPTNGTFISPYGAMWDVCPIIQTCSGGIAPIWASLFVNNTAAQNATIPEYETIIQSNLNSGKAALWAQSTAYTSGTYVTNNGNIYLETVASCTSASTGSGPTVSSGSVADNTCSWTFETLAYNTAKVNLFVDATTGANGSSQQWNEAHDFVLNSGWTGNFGVNAEFDISNISVPYDYGYNIYNLYVSGSRGTYPVAADLGFYHPPSGTNPATHNVILIDGAYESSSGDIGFTDTNTPAHIAMVGGVTLGSLIINETAPEYIGTAGSPTYEVWADSSTTGAAANLSGTYSFAAISTVNATTIEALVTAAGQEICLGNTTAGCMSYNSTYKTINVSPAGIQTGGFTIAALPSCNATSGGMHTYVTNGQASPAFLGTVSTTGSTVAPVWCNGSIWVYGG